MKLSDLKFGVLALCLAAAGASAQSISLSAIEEITAPTATAASAVTPLVDTAEAEQIFFRSVNAEREAAGLPKLTWNSQLHDAAAFHNARVIEIHTLQHEINGEPHLPERAAHAGVHFSRIDENLAMGREPEHMHASLMLSPHHRANILDPEMNSMAVSVKMADGALWVVEDFVHDVQPLSIAEQEQRLTVTLTGSHIFTQANEAARVTCGRLSGYAGERPDYIVRYTTTDLNTLPDLLKAKLGSSQFRRATVGACPAGSKNSFAVFSVAIMLYR